MGPYVDAPGVCTEVRDRAACSTNSALAENPPAPAAEKIPQILDISRDFHKTTCCHKWLRLKSGRRYWNPKTDIVADKLLIYNDLRDILKFLYRQRYRHLGRAGHGSVPENVSPQQITIPELRAERCVYCRPRSSLNGALHQVKPSCAIGRAGRPRAISMRSRIHAVISSDDQTDVRPSLIGWGNS